MANKKTKNTPASKGKSTGKKTTGNGTKKPTQAPGRNTKKATPSSGENKRNAAPRRSTVCKILPYLFLLFALILTICYVIVHLAGLEDGAGVVGYGIQWFVGGLLGGGSLLLPLALGYVGIKWCLYNARWKDEDMDRSSSAHADYRRAKKRMILQGVMSFLVVLIVGMIFGVVADYGDMDLATMWEDGAEELFLGGGVIGSSLGCLMVMAFETVISLVILIILLPLFLLLAL